MSVRFPPVSTTTPRPDRTDHTSEVSRDLQGRLDGQIAGRSGQLRDVAEYRYGVSIDTIDQGAIQQMVQRRFYGDAVITGDAQGIKVTVYGTGAIHAYGPNARKI